MNVSRSLGKHIFLFAVSLVVTIGCKNVMGPETGPSPSTGPGSPALGGWVSITGSPIVGETLTAEVTLLSAGGSVSYSYQGGRAVSPGGAASRAAFSFLDEAGVSIQWLRDNVVIGAGKTYTVQAEDAGCSITVRVSYPGYSGSVSSAPECSSPVLTFIEASQGLPDGLYITGFVPSSSPTPMPSGQFGNRLTYLKTEALSGFSYTLVLAAGTETITAGDSRDTPTLNRGINLTLQGPDSGTANITLNGTGALFVIKKASLILEKNTTLTGYASNIRPLVQVFDHGALELGAGSAISGNTNTTAWEGGEDGWGSGVAVFNGKLTMTGGEIKNNTTQGDGGGVFIWQESVFTMTGGEISGNRAGKNGGGVKICERNAFNISGGTIKDNHADDGPGGGITIGEGSTATISGGTISENTAHHGGGIHIGEGSTATISSGTISGNTVIDCGGGIYIGEGSAVEISGGTIIDGNTANGHGGGISVWKGSVKMTGGTISRNTASDYGGGIDVEEGSVEISGNTEINENETDGSGGGIRAWRKVLVKMTGGTISGNTAVDYGGGIIIGEGSTATISGGTISGNTAKEGGGINIDGTIDGSTVTISSGTISLNEAEKGGGIFVWAGLVKMTGGTISGNTASECGGGIFVHHWETNFTKTGGLIDGGPGDYQSPVNRVVNGSNALVPNQGHAIYIDLGSGLWRDDTVNDNLSYSAYIYTGTWDQ